MYHHTPKNFVVLTCKPDRGEDLFIEGSTLYYWKMGILRYSNLFRYISHIWNNKGLVMFGIVGRVVIYGFCLYGMLRMFQDRDTSETEEGTSAKV
jgi:hypothetical protein